MTATRSSFDRLIQGSGDLLDRMFGKRYIYITTSQNIPVELSLLAHDVMAQLLKEGNVFESWHGHSFLGKSDQLVDYNGEVFEPIPGQKIYEEKPDGTWDVFIVTNPPKGRCYDYMDAEQVRIVIHTVYNSNITWRCIA